MRLDFYAMDAYFIIQSTWKIESMAFVMLHLSTRTIVMLLAMSTLPILTSENLFAEPTESAAKPLILEATNIIALQKETEDPSSGRYDWGPSVMKDGELYKMWWVRLGGANKERYPYHTLLENGETFEFTYPDWGDRIYYAESRDGRTWNISGDDYQGSIDDFGPDSRGPLLVLQPAQNAYERHHIACPSVIKVEGFFYLYYEACSDYVVTIGPDGKPVVGTEYHNSVFVAESKDGKRWKKHPNNENPQPIIQAPDENKKPGHQRYGLGQPSVCYRNGLFILHYVDSCTGPGDFMVRIEADDPYFKNPVKYSKSLISPDLRHPFPEGAVSKFAQTDIKYLGDRYYLVRPAYGTGNLNLLASRTGLFNGDTNQVHPRDVFPQLKAGDPRGAQYLERLFPHFLIHPSGEILIDDGRIIIYYSSGRGFKEFAYTWDLQRAEVEQKVLFSLPDDRIP